MKVCPVFGPGGWFVAGVAIFLDSFAPGETAAPNGFVCSACGLGRGFVRGGDSGPVLVGVVGVVGLEPDENLELMLDIHEFRLPKRGCRGSLGLLGEFGVGDSNFSELVW